MREILNPHSWTMCHKLTYVPYWYLIRPKKYSCFRKCGWREKSSPGWPQVYFFNWFSGDILFSFLVSLLFCILVFFCAFVCFLKLKIYIFHPADFRKQESFLGQNNFEKLHLINSKVNLRPPQHLKWSFLWH